MPFEDELTDVIHATGRSFDPDLNALVNAGVTEGRRLRRRRTLGILGSVTALAVVGVGGAVATGSLSAGPAHRQTAPTGPAAHGVLPSGPPTHPSAGSVSTPPLPVFTAGQMIAAFESMLPKGMVSGARGTGITATTKGGYTFVSGPSASLVLTDDRGPSALAISIDRQASIINDRTVQQYLTCPSRTDRPDIACSRTALSNGTVVTLVQGLENPNDGSREKDWTAYLATPNGSLITLDETDSTAEKGSVGRALPILSAAQLRAIVTAPLWQKVTSELPAPPAAAPQTGTARATLSADRITSTLRAALPPGVTLTLAGSGQDGYAEGLLDDGHGVGLVGVNADHFGPAGAGQAVDPGAGGAAAVGAPSATAVTVLADGTRVLVTQGRAEKGGKDVDAWTVAVLHRDGRRIVVSELNAPAYQAPRDRLRPVLTIDQLKALALSPSWVDAAW